MVALHHWTQAAAQYLGHDAFSITSQDGSVTGIVLSNTPPESAAVSAADIAAIKLIAQQLEAEAASAALGSYNTERWSTASRSGVSVNIGTELDPIVVLASTDADGKSDLLGLQSKASLGLPITWFQSTGVINITNAQLQTIALAVADHVEDAIGKWAAVQSGIADGSITTTEQIDAAYDG